MTERTMTTTLPNAKHLRRIGFTDRREGYWYLCRHVMDNVTFNVTIRKETGGISVDVMNELFGQPEMYGQMRTVYRDLAMAQINVHVYELNNAGIPVSINHAEYGCGEQLKIPTTNTRRRSDG